MSLEAALADFASAVRENTEELRFLTSAARKGAQKAAEEAPKSTRAAKAEADEEAKPARRTRTTKTEKAVSVKDAIDAARSFLDVADESEEDERRSIIKRIVKKFGVEKISEIADKNAAEVVRMIDVARAGDDPFEDAGEDDDLV